MSVSSLARQAGSRLRVKSEVFGGPRTVFLDENMSVQDVFEKTQSKLDRTLKYGKLVALNLRLDKTAEAVIIEIDDSEAWEAIADDAKTAGSSRMWGRVIVE